MNDRGLEVEVQTKNEVRRRREGLELRRCIATFANRKIALGVGAAILRPRLEIASGEDEARGTRANLRGQPVTVKSAQADFDQVAMRIEFTGGATAEQGQDVMSGDQLGGLLNEQKHVKHILARGNSYLRTMSQGHAAEVFAAEFDFYFDDQQKLQTAQARQNVRAKARNAGIRSTIERLSPSLIAVARSLSNKVFIPQVDGCRLRGMYQNEERSFPTKTPLRWMNSAQVIA